MGGQWRYSDTTVQETSFVAVGPDLGPSGPANRTYEVIPHAQAADFDDTAWIVLSPPVTQRRLSTGRVCFNWYRITVTLPERVGDLDVAGSTVAFETVVYDYAEVWVNGSQPLAVGNTGGQVVAGFNTPNRVVLTQAARPGQRFTIAVFGINGPISAAPANYIWMRTATLDFYPPARARTGEEAPVQIVPGHPGRDTLGRIVPSRARLERIAGGFEFTEGPVWTRDGALLFSSPNTNTIYRWDAARDGYGVPPLERIYRCRHRPLRPARLERAHLRSRWTADHLPAREQARDPGRAARQHHRPRRPVRRQAAEQPQRPRVCLRRNPVLHRPAVRPARDVRGPEEGIAVQRRLRPSATVRWRWLPRNWPGRMASRCPPMSATSTSATGIPDRKIVMRYTRDSAGSVTASEEFFDMTGAEGEDAIDGLKVDTAGHVYVCGPSGIWLLSPGGEHLGTLRLPESPHNLAWGDDDARTLYITALTSIYRIRLAIPGVRPH